MRSPSYGPHILAGDDSPAVLDLFREILEEEGYRVTTAREALGVAEIKRLAPDLVIIDHMLEDGEGSGWQLLRELRDDPATANLPIVICTGAVQQVRASEALLRQQNIGIVYKPFDIDELVQVIADACPQPSVDLSGSLQA